MFGRRLSQDRYINPLTDFGFKRLFGTEPNKAILIDFLNVILPEHHTIVDLSYRNSEHIGNTALDRKAVFDIYCKSESGERFIVEIQKAKQNFFKDRSVYYSTFPIQDQAKQGIWDFQLSSVYTVGVLDFIFDDHKDDDTILHTVELRDQKCEVFYDKLKFIYIELPKFKKTIDELETHFDKWLFLLRHLPDIDDPPQKLQSDTFRQLFEVAEIVNFSLDEFDAYEDSLKYYRDLNNVVATSRQEGLEEGREEGRKESLEEGCKEATVELVIRLVRKRLGVLSESEQAAISALSVAKLERLSEDLMAFSTASDLAGWLDQNSA
ncbi:MAG: Rpn family recombination-promoting nuclease/putative transposase [Cyanobacteria bacterium J06623_5]